MAFGTLGKNVTHKIRTLLYSNILQKHIGFFDEKDNGTGILTAAMSQDTSIINGVSTESLGPQFEALCALGAGCAIGFYFCWQMSCVMLGLAPFMIVGNMIQGKFSQGLTEDSHEISKQANNLCSDAIIGYKTV